MPPEFLDLIYLIPPVSDHVAKFHGDRSRDGGEKLAKEINKKKHHEQNRRPPVLPNGRSKKLYHEDYVQRLTLK